VVTIYLQADILLQHLSEEAEESHKTSKVRTSDPQIEVKNVLQEEECRQGQWTLHIRP